MAKLFEPLLLLFVCIFLLFNFVCFGQHFYFSAAVYFESIEIYFSLNCTFHSIKFSLCKYRTSVLDVCCSFSLIIGFDLFTFIFVEIYCFIHWYMLYLYFFNGNFYSAFRCVCVFFLSFYYTFYCTFFFITFLFCFCIVLSIYFVFLFPCTICYLRLLWFFC